MAPVAYEINLFIILSNQLHTCEDDAVGRVLAPVLHEVNNIPHSEGGVPGEQDAGHAEVTAQL